MVTSHREQHRTQHIGWLRASVLGATDGIVSTASLVVGMAASNASHQSVVVAGIAGLVAGAMSMAAGEYVSVSSQADTERADIDRERMELAVDAHAERAELAAIYGRRGLDASLAEQVAEQLMLKDALAAHARDELGISETMRARPIQAALASAAAFAVGAILPLMTAVLAVDSYLTVLVTGTSLIFLTLLGILAAYTGGSSIIVGAMRVAFWGALAMALTAGVGAIFETPV